MKRFEAPSDRAERRRATWPVDVKTMGEAEVPVVFGTPESRLRAVGELTEQAWALAGKPVPTYERHNAPVRLTHRHELEDLET